MDGRANGLRQQGIFVLVEMCRPAGALGWGDTIRGLTPPGYETDVPSGLNQEDKKTGEQEYR